MDFSNNFVLGGSNNYRGYINEIRWIWKRRIYDFIHTYFEKLGKDFKTITLF